MGDPDVLEGGEHEGGEEGDGGRDAHVETGGHRTTVTREGQCGL